MTGKPVVTTAGAMSSALEHLGARNIALVTPYLDLVNERLRAFLPECGIGVEVLASFRAQTVNELAAIKPEQIAALARAVMTDRCDALFIACSQLPTARYSAISSATSGVPPGPRSGRRRGRRVAPWNLLALARDEGRGSRDECRK